MNINLKPYYMETRRPIDRGKREHIIAALTSLPDHPPRPTAQEIGAEKKLRIIERLRHIPNTPSSPAKDRTNK